MSARDYVHIEAPPYSDDLRLHFGQRQHDGSLSVAVPAVFKPIAAGEFVGDSVLRFSKEVGQELMNELWRAGIRPHNGEGGPAHVEAMKAHLADLRRIAFPESIVAVATAAPAVGVGEF